MNRMRSAGLGIALAFVSSAAWAKIPQPPALDQKGTAAAEEKKAKDAATAEAAKKSLADAQDKAVKNYQEAHMRKSGKKETQR